MKLKRSHILFSLAWIICISFVVGSIHSWHLAEFKPKKDSIKIENIVLNTKNYGVIHFLTPMCSCSETILDHLVLRGPLGDEVAQEMVVLIDDEKGDYTKNLEEKGFRVLSTDFESAKKKFSDSISGVPLLVIYNSEKESQYTGGYSKRLITPFTKIDIKSFIDKLSSGRSLAALPVNGCSVSKEFQKILDPLGLKYTKE